MKIYCLILIFGFIRASSAQEKSIIDVKQILKVSIFNLLGDKVCKALVISVTDLESMIIVLNLLLQ